MVFTTGLSWELKEIIHVLYLEPGLQHMLNNITVIVMILSISSFKNEKRKLKKISDGKKVDNLLVKLNFNHSYGI